MKVIMPNTLQTSSLIYQRLITLQTQLFFTQYSEHMVGGGGGTVTVVQMTVTVFHNPSYPPCSPLDYFSPPAIFRSLSDLFLADKNVSCIQDLVNVLGRYISINFAYVCIYWTYRCFYLYTWCSVSLCLRVSIFVTSHVVYYCNHSVLELFPFGRWCN